MSPSLPDQHRVWAWLEKGEPGSLAFEMRSLPVPSPGEVLIANRAVGLNPVDWKMIERGHAAWRPGHIPGVDGMGTIAALGEGVRLPRGLRVAYHQSLLHDGSFADFVSVDARSLIPVPEGVDDVIAAALPCPGLTASQALRKIPDRAGRDVLVTGAGGSVGLLLAQLAVQDGCRVWGTAAPSHRETLLSFGVCGVFDYRDPNWREQLAADLGVRRLSAVFDTVSGAHARSLAPMIGYNGHLVCIQDRMEDHPLSAFGMAVSLHEVALNSAHQYVTDDGWRDWREAGMNLFNKLEAGLLRLPAIETCSLDALPAALTALKRGARKGKFVVIP